MQTAAIPGETRYEFTFTAEGDWTAMRLAERFLADRGFAYGPTQAGAPRAVMFGRHYLVSKWRNLTRDDKARNHGVMLGVLRTGPIMVVIYPTAPADAIAAVQR